MADYDDGAYYEVQLNNKQLVFFFMATLAIAVVVFLCGVMVGRGVRDATQTAARTDIRAANTPAPKPEEAAAKPPMDYPERLGQDAKKGTLQPAVTSEGPETIVRKAVATPPPAPRPKPRQEPSTLGRSEGAFTIQVVALKTRDAAQALLGRLQSKNYRAYLEAGEGAGLHRVRVGRFSTRGEAELVAQKLRDEEKFKPYITQ